MATKNQQQPTGLETLSLDQLDDVTGGRVSHSGGPDPQTTAAIKSLAELIQSVGSSMVQAKSQSSQQMMQMMQQMMSGKAQ